jgi:hypothetical protein
LLSNVNARTGQIKLNKQQHETKKKTNLYLVLSTTNRGSGTKKAKLPRLEGTAGGGFKEGRQEMEWRRM